MKSILSTFVFLFLSLYSSYGQMPVYYFTASHDSTIESNSYHIAGYVKTNNAPTTADSVVIRLKSGSPRPTHMDTSSSYVVNFAAGQDSVPFVIHIMSDTFPEYTEYVLFTLSDAVNGATIGLDSTLLFILSDTTPRATVGFILDTASGYETQDSFYNGAYVSTSAIYTMGIVVNNPNTFYVRYYPDNIDCNTMALYPFLNACAGSNFYFNGEICYAPPGISTYYKNVYIVNQNSTFDRAFYGVIKTIDATIVTDTFCLFTIRHTNYFTPPSLSFDHGSEMIVGDSFPQIVSLPVTINNPNRKPLYFHIDTVSSNSTYPGLNYSFNSYEYGYGPGITHDTFYVDFNSLHRSGDTTTIRFALRNDSINISADTLYTLTIIDTGSLTVSFLGAGLAHLKSDSVGYVQVYTSSVAKYPISARISYLNGNAVRGTDFTFNDTTVTFPAFAFDTISLPVFMLQDHLYQGNTQVNLQLTNVTPSAVQYDIIQYTYTIIDNEDSGLTPLLINAISDIESTRILPNPFKNLLRIETTMNGYEIIITNSLGQVVYDQPKIAGSIEINSENFSPGIYLVKLKSGNIFSTAKVLKL